MDDDLRQPLKRRSFLSRMVSARPSTLRATTVGCIVALAGVGVWAVATHEPYGGQPVVHMQIDTSDPIITSSLNKSSQPDDPLLAEAEPSPAAEDDEAPMDIGANTEVIDLSNLSVSKGNSTGGESDLDRRRREMAENNRVRDEPAADSPPGAISIDDLPVSREGEVRTAFAPAREVMSLVPAPVASITGDGPHGLLPVVARNGARAASVYARPVSREQTEAQVPKIALLIGGMGLNPEITRSAISQLPPEVTLAFAPYGDNLQELANLARAQGHELFIQLPMEPFGYPSVNPGPYTLLTSVPAPQNIDSLHWHLGRFTGYAGVTNYLGAQFASNEQAFGPVLKELGKRGLVYVDDGSRGLSKATSIASRFGLPASSASVSLDGDSHEAVTAALQRLEAQATSTGFAIGTGAGLPHTIRAIEEWSRTLGGREFILVPVSAAFARRSG